MKLRNYEIICNPYEAQYITTYLHQLIRTKQIYCEYCGLSGDLHVIEIPLDLNTTKIIIKCAKCHELQDLQKHRKLIEEVKKWL